MTPYRRMILRAIRNDRRTIAEISNNTGLSQVVVREIVNKMTEDGTIEPGTVIE